MVIFIAGLKIFYTRSNIAPIQSGVSQGSIQGPTLFLLYINDLPDYQSAVRHFTHDYVLYRQIKNNADANLHQEDLETLEAWENDWLMEFHPNKCPVIHITNNRKPIRQSYNIHGHVLDEIESAKYLTANIHHKLNWNTHTDQVVRKANNTRAFFK
ncbi:unnamed protein product [Mytilus coruscus]|uniref:Reverse transcriptase domain-containing protein n=1 Tax=Mytilus coruscus TaxID=42192 RepID=A0A6J8CSM9_MYTCO|nr:unnamed protein product [Mytilus coruscus]